MNSPILAIASSTGGPEALRALLSQFNENIPPILIVQHMPVGFTKLLANGFNKFLPFEVREACHGDEILPGRVLIAPAGYHMEVANAYPYNIVVLHKADPQHGVRPAADYLFNSVAHHYGKKAVGVILTGMGKDGAKGLEAMKRNGSFNIAQDEASSIVYGMPKAAVELGAIDVILPLNKIAQKLKTLKIWPERNDALVMG